MEKSINKSLFTCGILLSYSHYYILQLSEDKTKVRRKEPLGEPEFDPDDVTVYVVSITIKGM